jgi:hypothetical protein
MASEDYRYVTLKDGRTIDLLAPINLNQNPYDIEPLNGHPSSYVCYQYNYFNRWMFPEDFEGKQKDLLVDAKFKEYPASPDKINPTDTSVNSNKWVSKTIDLIKQFNENVWYPLGVKYPTNKHLGANFPLTTESIKAVQAFNQKTDPNVVIDGWLGTQTFQLTYPIGATLLASYWNKGNGAKSEINPDPDVWVPSVWGDYTFVIKNEYVLKFRENQLNGAPMIYYFIPYDPAKYKFLYNEYRFHKENEPHKEGDIWQQKVNNQYNFYIFKNGETKQVYPLAFEPTGYPPLELKEFKNGQYYNPKNWDKYRLSRVTTSETYGSLYYLQHPEWRGFIEKKIFPNNGTPPGQKIALVTPTSLKSNSETAKNQIKQKVAETEDKVRGAIAGIKDTISNIPNSL